MNNPFQHTTDLPEESESVEINPIDIRVAAMNFLARREHSVQELRKKLTRRFAEESMVDEQILRLTSEGLQSNARFAESYARQRISRGYGPVRLREGLRERGVSEADIDVTQQENIIGGPIEGKVCLMFDDMITTAGSICGAAQRIQEAGAREIHVAATHGVLAANAVDRLAAAVVHAPRDDPAEPDWLLAAAAELSEASYAPPVPRAEGKEAKVVGVEIQTQTSPAEVCHTDLEPQTSRPQAGLLLTPLGLALDSRLPSPSPSTRR